ncbi:MAG TPA: diacylglycerol kinase [Pirellulales bacterium]|jgi:diacylglycerol kinase (ATP)|nr:diacylglycerol kinase [Pirellulales bacterium]
MPADNLSGTRSPTPRTWYEKFRDAFRGVRSGMRGQSSFQVHIAVAVAVIVAGCALRVELWQWCVLLLCIGGVLTAEMVNSALEHLAKAVDEQRNPHLGDALDTGSAAVLFASLAAAVVGAIILLSRVIALLKG